MNPQRNDSTTVDPMIKPTKRRVLLLGILSPFIACFLNVIVGELLLHYSVNPEKDWRFRLTVSTVVMIVPFAVTLVLALKARRHTGLLLSGKIGIAIALLSLSLVAKPLNDGITRAKQERNSQVRDLPAPLFDTPDLSGKSQRLANYKGKVILVNVWATWCAPCRAEMPALDRLYRERKDRGFVVLGMSDENVETQKEFQDEVKVSYPLLTWKGNVPHFYRDIARYPALFLIDRQGKLQPATDPEQPFEKIAASVDALLSKGPLR